MQLLKLGGSAITKKHGYMEPDLPAIRRLAKTIARALAAGCDDIVIVHGAGSFGHAPVLKYKLNEGVRTAKQKKGCKITQKACAQLSFQVTSALHKAGVAAVSIAPHGIIKSKNKRIAKFNFLPIKRALSNGVVPVLYGDMVPDSKLGSSVCSGDQIIAYLGKRARRIVLASNVDGVLARGKVVPLITRKNFPKIARHITGSKTPDVTGGMAGKIKEIMDARAPSYVVNAKKPSRVLALLLGKKAVCTKVNQ
ncbi:MAG: isopentenyl phosphate kinase [Candidatus Micrarchaeota archaeon]|nr:isopentenyl phosphate kinase [Candidatus Micrarchaeota archaeon]